MHGKKVFLKSANIDKTTKSALVRSFGQVGTRIFSLRSKKIFNDMFTKQSQVGGVYKHLFLSLQPSRSSNAFASASFHSFISLSVSGFIGSAWSFSGGLYVLRFWTRTLSFSFPLMSLATPQCLNAFIIVIEESVSQASPAHLVINILLSEALTFPSLQAFNRSWEDSISCVKLLFMCCFKKTGVCKHRPFLTIVFLNSQVGRSSPQFEFLH